MIKTSLYRTFSTGQCFPEGNIKTVIWDESQCNYWLCSHHCTADQSQHYQVEKSVNAITFSPLLEATTHLDLDNENSPYLEIISLQEALNLWTTD